MPRYPDPTRTAADSFDAGEHLFITVCDSATDHRLDYELLALPFEADALDEALTRLRELIVSPPTTTTAPGCPGRTSSTHTGPRGRERRAVRSDQETSAAEERARVEARRHREMIERLAPLMPLYQASPYRDVRRAERHRPSRTER